MRRVVVIGSGAAGTAAALAAHEGGARVTVIRGRPGATSLTAGALDRESQSEAPDDVARATLEALGIYSLASCTLATSAGTMRSSSGRDVSLCDLTPAAGTVLVARVTHPAWDADALAASYAELDKTRTYLARDVGLVLHATERAMSHTELAALHDDDERLARTAERIRAALAEGGTFGAVLLPPWLGVDGPRAAALSTRVGAPCGEVLAALDGPSGARFERARDRCLDQRSIETVSSKARRVTSSLVELHDGRTIECDAVVLATGGLVGGGLAYTPGDSAPGSSRAPFALTYDAPVTLGHDGHAFVVPGSVFGIPPESLFSPAESPLIQRVGAISTPANIHDAGDACADRARTLLAAFTSGVVAGRAALRSP